MIGDIPDVGVRSCCVYKMPYDRHGPWTCPQCGLVIGWPCSGVAARTDVREVYLAKRLSDARVLLNSEPAWLNLIESELVDIFASTSESFT